jgi:hypothetical protein
LAVSWWCVSFSQQDMTFRSVCRVEWVGIDSSFRGAKEEKKGHAVTLDDVHHQRTIRSRRPSLPMADVDLLFFSSGDKTSADTHRR